jgi:hypothetical protein
MSALLVTLTIYANHSASTATVPISSMGACRQTAAGIQKQPADVKLPGRAEVYVITKCVEAK